MVYTILRHLPIWQVRDYFFNLPNEFKEDLLNLLSARSLLGMTVVNKRFYHILIHGRDALRVVDTNLKERFLHVDKFLKLPKLCTSRMLAVLGEKQSPADLA